jgi:hypothetical protein
MSPASSLTGLSSASSFSTFHRGAWCTPPRLFLEDQVPLTNQYFYLVYCVIVNLYIKRGVITSTCVLFFRFFLLSFLNALHLGTSLNF